MVQPESISSSMGEQYQAGLPPNRDQKGTGDQELLGAYSIFNDV